MTRLYQDYEFTVQEAANRIAERLIGAVLKGAPDDQPTVVFVKFADSSDWHRFFLQAHIGFWEVWDEEAANREFAEYRDNDVRLVSYASSMGGLPQTLQLADACVGEFHASNIRLLFESGTTLRLSSNTADIDTNFHITFQST